MNMFTDVLIVGSGAAGLYAALNLREDLKILVISKSKAKDCNTYLAQGGISVAKCKEDEESFIEDTLKAGQYINNKKAVEILVSESRKNIETIMNLGVDFDRKDNNLSYTREGAHSINRIVHSNDETGKALFEALFKQVKLKRNIDIMENTSLVDIVSENNICYGGIADRNGKYINIHAKVTILATGGIGGLFKNSTNDRSLTGDGIAIALKNGVKVKELEYVQFHPTALYESDLTSKKFLISEALRGEGAKLLNINGERFVDELLPRDVVTRAICEEKKKMNSPYVFLDITFKNKNYIKERFPGIYNGCLKKGIDITKDYIPVSPVQHYHMGGIDVDLYSRTSMKNLFACGEVSCTGVHGANRLASNSLLEALVFSSRAAGCINNNINSIEIKQNFSHIKDIKHIENINVKKEEELNKNIVIGEFNKMEDRIKNELVNY